MFNQHYSLKELIRLMNNGKKIYLHNDFKISFLRISFYLNI